MNVAFAELEQHAEALDFSGVDVENRAVADCGDAGGAHHGWDAEFRGRRSAARLRSAPLSHTTATALRKRGVHVGSVIEHTRTSPGSSPRVGWVVDDAGRAGGCAPAHGDAREDSDHHADSNAGDHEDAETLEYLCARSPNRW